MTGHSSTEHAVGGGLRELPSRARLQVVEETDSYTRSIAGATVEAIRVGRGIGPNRVMAATDWQLSVTRSMIGFPICTYSSVGADQVIATYVHRAPPGSRWCGIPLRDDSVIIYGPEVEHVAFNAQGLLFTFAATALEKLIEFGEDSGTAFEPPAPGEVRVLRPSAGTRNLAASLESYTVAAANDCRLERIGQEVLRTFSSLLAPSNSERPLAACRGIDSRDVVRACIDSAEALDQIPTIAEMCLAAHVSERRLREAFTDEFGEPPSRFFRSWALDRAHRRLREANPAQSTVTQIATAIGFEHLGRFAGHYQLVYGECPSTTLRAATGRRR